MYSKKRQANDFLDKCRVVSSFGEVDGFFVEPDFSTGIVFKRGYTENGEYQEEQLECLDLSEILEENPYETVLNLKQAIRDNFGRKSFVIHESLHSFMKEIAEKGYFSEDDFGEETEDDLSILFDYDNDDDDDDEYYE